MITIQIAKKDIAAILIDDSVINLGLAIVTMAKETGACTADEITNALLIVAIFKAKCVQAPAAILKAF